MNVEYDKEVDALYIKFSDNKVAKSDEQSRGLIVDYDKSGNIVGIELLNASKKIQEPENLKYDIA
jgi:uncharacterized protein YuzE